MERLTYNFSDIITGLCGTSRFFNKLSRGKLDAAISKLRDYEDAEEQGLLIKLPCRIGERTFELRYNTDACAECEKYEQGWYDEPPECAAGFCVFPIENFENSKPICEKHYLEIIESTFRFQDKDDFGKTVFLSFKEALAALAKLAKED